MPNTRLDTLGISRRRVLALGAAGGLLGAMGSHALSEPVEVHFWTLALSPWFDGYIRGQIASFEAAHPGVKVVWSDVPYDAMERKLIASAAAGRAPDVVNMSDMNFARFVSLGAFRDLGEELPGDARDVYLESALSLCTFENFRGSGRPALLGLPWYVNTQTLLANTALLARGFGTDVATRLSTDWPGLIAMAREFKERAGVFLFSQPLGEESEVLQMLLGQGLPPLREDAERGLAADLTRPEIKAYLQLWVDLYRDGGLPREAATKGHAHLTEMFQEGRLALANTGPNFLKRIRDAAPDVYRVTTVLPGMTGRLGRGHIPVMVLGSTVQSRHPREAAALAWWMTSARAQLEFCRNATILPSARAALDDPFFAPPTAEQLGGPEGKLLLARAVTARSLPNAAAFTCALETWPDLRRVFQDNLKRVLLDGKDLAGVLAQTQGEWDRILAAAPRASIGAVPRPGAVALPERALGGV